MARFEDSNIFDSDGAAITVQNPLQVDGDSVHASDIWVEESDMNGFSGVITDLFDNLHSVVTDTTTTNPKHIYIHFNRTTVISSLSLGAYTGNFSNVKVLVLTSNHTEIPIIDESADNTKYASRTFELPIVGFNSLRIEFHTADEVTLSNVFMPKVVSVGARIQGLDVSTGNFITIGAVAGEHGNNLNVSVDQTEPTTNSLKTIDYSHAELHGGTHYVARSYEAIAKNGVKELLVVTPDTTKWAHMVIGFEAVSSSVVVEFFEDTTTSADGTPDNEHNRNRNVADDNTTLIYEDPTVTTVGTLLSDGFFGAGKNSAGGGTRDSEEYLLKQNTKYLIRITEQNIAATVVNWNVDWYEHTNKN